MLFMEGGGRIIRVHAPFVHDGEVEAVANFLRQQGEPVYDENVTTEVEPDPATMGGMAGGNMGSGENGDASLYDPGGTAGGARRRGIDVVYSTSPADRL